MSAELILTVEDAQFIRGVLENQTWRGDRQTLGLIIERYDRVTAVLTAIIEKGANESGESAKTPPAA